MKVVKVLCCMLLFCFLAVTKHNSYLLLIEGPTNKNVSLRNSCIVDEDKMKGCTGSRTFQHKSWHL